MTLTGVLTISGGEDAAFVAPQLILTEAQHFVGRAGQHKKNFLNLKHQYVSGKHFSIDVGEDSRSGSPTFTLTDLSSNGTIHNGRVLGKGNSVLLADGDTIAIRFKVAIKIMYAFNIVEGSNVPPIAPDPGAPLAAPGSSTHGAEGRAHTDAEFDLLTKRMALLQAEMEDQEKRLSVAIARKEAALKDLATAQRDRDAAFQQVVGLGERTMELQSCNAAVEARSRILEEQVALLKSQVENQRVKISASAEATILLDELRARESGLKEELVIKAAHVESRQRLLDEANEALSKEAATRAAIEATNSKLRAALQSINTDLFSSEIEKSSSSVQLAGAAQKLGVAMANEKQLKSLLFRSQRVILAQRDSISTTFRSMSVLHKQLGQVLEAQLAHAPLQIGREAVPRDDHRICADSQIEELRSTAAADLNTFQSLLAIVEAEVMPSGVDPTAGPETFVDSILTARMTSIRSIDVDEDIDSQVSGIINGVGNRCDETQAQNCDFGSTLPVQFATQQGGSEPDVDAANHATEIPHEYHSPSEFMSPVTTPPGSAATPIPSGVKVKYRYGNKDMDDVHDNMGVKLDLDDYGAGFSFKRPLDIVMENATNGDNSGSSQHSSENEYRNNSRKFARIDSGTEGNLSAAVNEIVKSSPSKSRAKKPDDETILIVEESESGNIQNGDSMECTPGIKLG